MEWKLTISMGRADVLALRGRGLPGGWGGARRESAPRLEVLGEANVLGARTLGALADVERDVLSFTKRVERFRRAC